MMHEDDSSLPPTKKKVAFKRPFFVVRRGETNERPYVASRG